MRWDYVLGALMLPAVWILRWALSGGTPDAPGFDE